MNRYSNDHDGGATRDAVRWKTIPGFSRYEASGDGLVRNVSGFVLSRHVDSVGYPALRLVSDSGPKRVVRVHVVVAAAFIGPRPPGMDVRHIDGNRLNNAARNLAYGTRRQNQLDAVAHGTHGNTRKTHCPQGHPYDEANTWRPPSRPNRRCCKRCMADKQRLRRAAA